ncbi:MAG: prepilin-type N-terminal cleavage/methylation domain-containing protein [Terrimicrobiaceae bacterium]
MRRAFTLLELLVAMAVLLLLVLALSGIFHHASNAWLKGSGDVESRRVTRSLGDFIGEEMRGALLPARTASRTGESNLQFLINPPSGQVPEDYRNADAVFWQAPLATETSYGDLAEIGYFVKWDQSTPAKPRPVLCRFFVNPSTQASGVVAPNPNYKIYDATDPDAWLSPNLLDAVAPATSAQGYNGLFAENVIGLWVRSYGLDGMELPRAFDSRTGYTYKRQYQYLDADKQLQTNTVNERHYLPARVTVSIVQIDSHYLERLYPLWKSVQTATRASDVPDAEAFIKRLSDPSAPGYSPAFKPLLPGLHVYTTEIQLENNLEYTIQ